MVVQDLTKDVMAFRVSGGTLYSTKVRGQIKVDEVEVGSEWTLMREMRELIGWGY